MKKLFTLSLVILLAICSYAQEPGELNPSFGTEGSFVFDPSISHDKMEKILIQDDGKIITVGRARVDGSNYSIYVSRHNSDGTLDTTYGENGIAYFKANPTIYMNSAFDAAFDENGQLFVTGYTFDRINNTAFVLCLDENGIENTDFGENGFAISAYGNGIVYEAIAIDANGRPVVVGYLNDNILVRRYNIKGNIDKSFGEDGTVIIKLDPSPYAWSYAYDIKILENGKMLITGHTVSESGIYVSYILRLRANGTLDTTFGDEGVLELHAGEYAEYATSISVRPDGKYLVGGHADLFTTEPLPRSESFLVCVNANGSIDESFGTDGFVRLEPFEGDGCINETYSILAAADGQIFGTTYSYNYTSGASRAYVYNLDANGQFKEDFVGSGIMALPKYIENEMNVRALTLALKDNNNLLVGGYVADDNPQDQKLFLSCINVDVNDEEPVEPENPEDGIEELTSSLLLYPNPVEDRLYIETEVEVEEVVVYTITGVVVGQQTTVNGQQTSSIDVSNLKSGVYFVKIVTNEGDIVKRIIKQ